MKLKKNVQIKEVGDAWHIVPMRITRVALDESGHAEFIKVRNNKGEEVNYLRPPDERNIKIVKWSKMKCFVMRYVSIVILFFKGKRFKIVWANDIPKRGENDY